MEELSALRRHTVSEVKRDKRRNFCLQVSGHDHKHNYPGCRREEQEHPGVGSLQCWRWKVCLKICLSISDKGICVNGYLIFQNGRDDTLRHFEILRWSQHWHWHSKGKVWSFKRFSNSLFKVLSHLRQQRMLMVQTVAQVGKIILLFLSQPRFCFSTSSCTPRSSTTSARAGSSSWCQIRWSDSDQISSKVSLSDDTRSVLRQ